MKREDLARRDPVRRIPGRNRTKADVLFYQVGGRTVAVKDYSARPFWLRQTLGRWLVRREAAAFRAAEGVVGLPEFLGRLGPFTLATHWVEGAPLASLRRQLLDASLFDRLDEIVRALHERGIALGDLHHGDVLVAEDGAVHVVDLATAWRRNRWGPLGRAVFRRLRELDLVAAARIRARFTGGSTQQAAEEAGAVAAARHRRARRWKTRWDRLRGRRR